MENCLKKIGLCVVSCICFFIFAPSAPAAQSVELENAQKTLQLINHFSTVVYRITDSKDLAALEMEYDNISLDNIYLDVIEDSETIDIIKDIMTYITKQRMTEKERELLKQWLKEDLSGAIFATCPNPSGLVSANPKAIAYVTCQFAFSWFFHYMAERRRLLREFAKNEWELEKQQIEYLNERNEKLLELYWILVQRYNIKDYYRVTKNEIKEFVKYVDNDTEEHRVFEFLCLREKKYREFPEYWYRRGRSAEALGKLDEALASYRRYEQIHLQFLRKDRMTADVALNMARLLLDGKYKKNEMVKQLQIIETNVTPSDWTYLYFCGTTYMLLDMNQDAYRTLGIAVNELEHDLADKYKAYQDELKKKGDIEFLDKIPPVSYPLMMCRSAYLRACGRIMPSNEFGRKFSTICSRNTTSGFEAFTYCSPASHFNENLPAELWNMLHSVTAFPNGKLYFHMPLNWFLLGNEKNGESLVTLDIKYKERLRRSLPCVLKVFYAEGEPEEFWEFIDDREANYWHSKDKKTERFWMEVKTPFKHKSIAKRNVQRLELQLPLRNVSVSLVYLPKPGETRLFPKSKETYYPNKAIINGIEYELVDSSKQAGTSEAIGSSLLDFFRDAK